MASFTVDQKLMFERYDGVPGIGCRRLRKNIILHGGVSDENGWIHPQHFVALLCIFEMLRSLLRRRQQLLIDTDLSNAT